MAIVCGNLDLSEYTFSLDLSFFTDLLSSLALPSTAPEKAASSPTNTAPASDLSPSIPDLALDLGIDTPQLGCLAGEPNKCPAGAESEYYQGNSRFLDQSKTMIA